MSEAETPQLAQLKELREHFILEAICISDPRIMEQRSTARPRPILQLQIEDAVKSATKNEVLIRGSFGPLGTRSHQNDGIGEGEWILGFAVAMDKSQLMLNLVECPLANGS